MKTTSGINFYCKAIFALVCCCFSLSLSAQEMTDSTKARMLWPVAGQKVGENILYKPQQYIDNELNFDALFIGASEGSVVVAPTDGVLRSFSIDLITSLSTSVCGDAGKGNFNESLKEDLSDFLRYGIADKYITGSVSIRTKDGSVIHISGLRGNVPMKTGMRISRGDTLGTVAYAYHKISEPHIKLSISKGAVQDPMSPFGLESTFVAPEKIVVPEILTEEQAKEDLSILLNAYKECYPSLDEITTLEKVDSFANEAAEKFEGGISYEDFYGVVRKSTSFGLMHDSHLAVLTPATFVKDYGNNYIPPVLQGIVNDTVFVRAAWEKYKEHIGKRIVSIDGMESDEIRERTRDFAIRFDGNNSSIIDNTLLTAWNYLFENDVQKPRTSRIVLEDGTVIDDKWLKYGTARYYPAVQAMDISYYRNMYETEDYDFSMANDSTVLFNLNSFVLNQVQVEEIADSLKAHIDVPNMIIDLRNNPGGDVKVMEKLLSYFVEGPTVDLHSYNKVNSDSTYASFRYSANYAGDFEIFKDFEKREGRNGFYSDSDYSSVIEPDSTVNYQGRVYILADESSMSAATYFPSVLVRNHRAFVVGRETGSGYHYMTAEKFVDIILPNSQIQVRIPLVKSVFDETVTERTPAGRGLLPDLEVPISYEEVYQSEDDIILNKALELIAEGKYLGENPFAEIDNEGSGSGWLLHTVIAFLLVGGIGGIVGARFRRKSRKE